MNALIALPIVAPLLCAGLGFLLTTRPAAQRLVTIIGSLAATASAVGLAIGVERDGTTVVAVGGWQPPLGIVLVADLFAVVVLVVALLTALTVLVFATGHPDTERSGRMFGPLYLILITGVSMTVLAGDLFNLFVAFEIMLSASYVLLTLGGERDQIRRSMTYVVISLLASVLFITTLGLLYAATGTVNLSRLGERLADIPSGTRTAFGLLLFVVFAIKAAVFPVFSWLPDSYPTAPAPVTAIFAGLATKIGVYALVRTQTALFPRDDASALFLTLAALTMIVGVLGAIAQTDMKRILSFHIVSQIGYMLMGLGLYSVAGVAGTIFFLLHQMPVKTSLFLAEGLIEQRTGTSRLDRVGGMIEYMPFTATLFGLGALSLAGIPPMSGFVGKFALVRAGIEADQWAIVAVSLAASVLTLFSMVKIWNGIFWGEPMGIGDQRTSTASRAQRTTMMTATVACAAITLAIAFAAGPLYRISERAATELLDPTGSRPQVLDP